MRKPAPLRCAGLHNLLPVIWRLYFNKLIKLNIQFLSIVPKRRDIVQVMQFLQIDLPKFRFTELGSKLAIELNNNMHKF